MSLLEAFARPCVKLSCAQTPDGAGGFHSVWEEGAALEIFLALDSSREVCRAEQAGVKSVYTALSRRDAPISHGDWLKDTETGQVFRVTSHPEERKAPGGSPLGLKVFTVERGRDPNDQG